MRLKTLFVFLITTGSMVFAQSDYERVENFKSVYEKLQQEIAEASSIGDYNSLEREIDSLEVSYSVYKDLLNKALYPDTFENYFISIKEQVIKRRFDAIQIATLDEKVFELKDRITILSTENSQLISEIQDLSIGAEKDAATISELRKLNSQLKYNIEKRDLLVRGMIDTLLTGFIRAPTTLNEAEKQTIIGDIENRSLFYNIERVISDNVDYLEVTQMTIEDFTKMRSQYIDFHKAWGQLGTKLADVYLSRKEGMKELAYIDGLFDKWNIQIDLKIWDKLRIVFLDREIVLLSFEDGDQFKESVISFIDSEIDNFGLKKDEESKKTFDIFTDGVYYKIVQPKWFPFLIDNGLINKAHKIDIEAKIAQWKEVLFPPPSFFWLYIIILVMVVIQIVLYVLRRRKKMNSVEQKKIL